MRKTGIIYFEAGEEITENTINYFEKNKIEVVEILDINSNKKDHILEIHLQPTKIKIETMQ